MTSMTCSLCSSLVRPALYVTNLIANVILVLYNSSINKVNITLAKRKGKLVCSTYKTRLLYGRYLTLVDLLRL